MNFDKHVLLCDKPYGMQFKGLYKNGLYGYPHSLIHDGYFYVIYSKRKEAIEIIRIAIADLP